MSNVRTVKKGEFLFKEGDKITHFFQVQQGAVSICILRPKKTIPLFSVGTTHILGEQYFSGVTTHPFSAQALQETKVLEIPASVYKSEVDASHNSVKILVKSLLERLKTISTDLKSSKMEIDPTPCPEDQVAKVFGTIYHTARHKGEKLDEKKHPKRITIDWTMMKQYSQRVFGESPRRLESAVSVLVKLKLAEFEMGKSPDDPEGPDQIMKVHFSDLDLVEAFFEFYQYYFFKGTGKPETLKPEDSIIQLVTNLLGVFHEVVPDRYGVVSMDFSKTIELFKTKYNITLTNEHFTRLEQKGLFAKRAPRSEGPVVLSFDIKEFSSTLFSWKVIKEIEKWNEKGFVDLNEKSNSDANSKSDGPACGSCGSALVPAAKFCPECGAKVQAAA